MGYGQASQKSTNLRRISASRGQTSAELLKRKATELRKSQTGISQVGPTEQNVYQAQVTIDDFNITKKLGEGAFGKVWLAEDKIGNLYAIKTLSKDFLRRTGKVNSVFRERDILIQNKKCRYLPRIFHSFMDEEYLYIAMEYVSNGTLINKINFNPEPGLSTDATRFYAAQIIVTLEYLQSQNVCHRDLKPGNIMIDELDYIKIIDFGEAKIIDKYE